MWWEVCGVIADYKENMNIITTWEQFQRKTTETFQEKFIISGKICILSFREIEDL